MNVPTRMKVLLWISVLVFSLASQNCRRDTPKDPVDSPVSQNCGIDAFSMNPFPVSAHYPVPARTLESWVQNKNIPRIRAHGWRLFAGLQEVVKDVNDQDAWRWQTWPTATQAISQETSPGPLGSTGTPVSQRASHNLLELNLQNSTGVPIDFKNVPQYRVPKSVCDSLGLPYDPTTGGCGVPTDGCKFQNNGDVMIAGVIYSPEAYKWIRDQGLYLWDTLKNQFLRNFDKEAVKRQIAPFPTKSFVLKPMFWPVQKEGYTALPVWRNSLDTANFNYYSGFEEQKIWKNAVAISADPQQAYADVSFLYDVYKDTAYTMPLGPNNYIKAPVVSIDDFYHWQIDQATLDAMDSVDLALLNQSAYWCYKREFRAGDYIALIAMHVITKEMPEWTLQSFYWSDQAGPDNPYASGRDSVQNPPSPQAFNNYLMTSTYGISKKSALAEWPTAFNPYIELAAAHPIQTNCRNCHRRGAFPNSKQLKALAGYTGKNAASYMRAGANFPGALDTFDIENSVMDSLLITDFQWTLTDRVQAE